MIERVVPRIMEDISSIERDSPLKIIPVHTNKRTFERRYVRTIRDNRYPVSGLIYLSSAYKLFQVFIDYLEQIKMGGSIYADSRYNQDRDLLNAFLKIRDAQFDGGASNPYAINLS